MTAKNTSLIIQPLRLIFRTSPWFVVLLLVLSILQGILPLWVIYLVKQLIDCLIEIIKQPGLSLYNSDFYQILTFTGIAFFLSQSIAALTIWTREVFSVRLTQTLFEQLHKKSAELPYWFFESAKHQDIAYRARNELAYRPEILSLEYLQLVQNAISFILAIGLILTVNIYIGFILFVLIVPGIMLRLKYARRQHEWNREKTALERKVMYFSRILTDSIFAKEIRLFSLDKYFRTGFKVNYHDLSNENLKLVKEKTLADIGGQLIITLLLTLSIWWIAYQTILGSITSGDMVMYLLIFQRSVVFIRNIMSSLAGIYEHSLGMTYLFEFMDIKTEIKSDPEDKTGISDLNYGFEFKDVCFSYPGHEKPVFEHLNLTIPAGKITVLAGPNGSGKTTLIKLITRLFEPTQGKILYDSVEIQQINRAEYTQKISVLFQDFVLYHLSAFENIHFGDITRSEDFKLVKEAAQKAGIDSILEVLPQGYETTLGYLFENSEELSLGQWQRLALARAFYKDAPIILLDEPTASLDAQSEADLFAKIRTLLSGKTAIIVSHRLSTARLADKVVLFTETGEIESGSHDVLLSKNGSYASLFNLQANPYR